jgi:hypothetical protein
MEMTKFACGLPVEQITLDLLAGKPQANIFSENWHLLLFKSEVELRSG